MNLTKIPLVDLNAQYAGIRREINQAIQRVLNNTSFILGKEVSDFEQAFASYVNATGAVGVASGTAALFLALSACGIGHDDEVITTAHTFMATAEAISQTGARPIFIDIDSKTYNIDVDLVEDAITNKTRAILPVHLYGHPVQMDQLSDIAKRHNLWLIEDAAQAHGAKYKGQPCGRIGHIGCFSFYPGKNLGAYGDAGAVTSNDEELLKKIRSLRNHGRMTKYEHKEVGFGERMDALQAAILSVKLQYLEEWTEARRDIARLYNRLLADSDITIPCELQEARHVYHLYVIRTLQRDKVLDHLRSKGIGAGIHYPIPLHRQPVYAKQINANVFLPVTERIAKEIISLPMYPELNEKQIHYVVQTIKEVV